MSAHTSMQHLKTRIPAYLRHFVRELRKEGTPRETIRGFASYWKRVAAHARELPCPFCFADGANGSLTVLGTNGADLVRCGSCRSEVVVDR